MNNPEDSKVTSSAPATAAVPHNDTTPANPTAEKVIKPGETEPSTSEHKKSDGPVVDTGQNNRLGDNATP